MYKIQKYFKSKNFFYVYLIFFCSLSINTIYQYSVALNIPDGMYRIIFGDGADHINYLVSSYNGLSLKKIHWAITYGNNYYILPLPVLYIYNFFIKDVYISAGLSLITVNLISLYFCIFFIYKISEILSKSKICATFCVILSFHKEFLFFSFSIYPDTLQFSLLFGSIFFFFSNIKFNYFWAFALAGLSFGTKGQGLLIFIYLITLYFFICEKYFLKRIYKSILATIIFLFFFTITNPLFYNIYYYFINFTKSNDITKFNNFEIVNNFLINEIFKSYFIIILFVFVLISIFFYFIKIRLHDRKIFFVSLLMLGLFYLSMTNYKDLVHGSRYVHHFLGPLIVIYSVGYKLIIDNFNYKKINFIFSYSNIAAIVILCWGLFGQMNLNFINFYKGKEVKTEKVLNYISSEKFLSKYYGKEVLICAGAYSFVPKNLDKSIIRTWFFKLDVGDNEINLNNCDLLIMDSITPGFLLWINDDQKEIDNTRSVDVKQLDKFWLRLGEENLKDVQKFLKNNFFNKNQKNFVPVFISNHVIIFEKNKN